MKLHQDRGAFEDLLAAIRHKTGIRDDILEKDYYLTLFLWELAKKQDTLDSMPFIITRCIDTVLDLAY